MFRGPNTGHVQRFSNFADKSGDGEAGVGIPDP
jgi:hypothetical protein